MTALLFYTNPRRQSSTELSSKIEFHKGQSCGATGGQLRIRPRTPRFILCSHPPKSQSQSHAFTQSIVNLTYSLIPFPALSLGKLQISSSSSASATKLKPTPLLQFHSYNFNQTLYPICIRNQIL